MDIKNLRSTTFIKSAIKPHQFPKDFGAEVAFAGRSNAGKSTVINTITGIKKLARSSKTPGRTQMLNFFEVEPHKRLVDLPGFGFTRLPPKIYEQWEQAMAHYLAERPSLKGIFLIMDCRHPLQKIDQEMLDICIKHQIETHILLNKADKLSNSNQHAALQNVTNKMSNLPAKITVQLFSCTKHQGVTLARTTLKKWLS